MENLAYKNLDGHEHFVAKITIMLKWHDPRLANWNPRVPKNIWKPEFYSFLRSILNANMIPQHCLIGMRMMVC